ncbi:MFS transporter [Bacillus gobiensis]|uniref:MFS transporter n=1 Tax=Bacillus gobiensis TaxID=1441095 RepID=UPI003D204C82
MDIAKDLNEAKTRVSYPLITLILFWCGLVVLSSLYIMLPLLSIFSDVFHVEPGQAAWTSSSFSLCYAVGLLFFGTLSERYGRKQIIVYGLCALAVVTLLTGLANSLALIIVLRGIQGFAASTFAPAALAYIAERFPIEKRVTTIGFVTTGFLMAGIAGQVLSSIVSQASDWNSVFFILGAIYFITAFFAALFIPKQTNAAQTSTIADSFRKMTRLLQNRSLIFCYSITFMLLFTFVGMYTALGSFLTGSNFGLTGQEILYIRSIGIIGILLSPFAGKFVSAFGLGKVLKTGLLAAVLGLAMLGAGSNLAFLIGMTVVFVAGIAVVVPTLISLVGMHGGKERGAAVTLYMFILFIGASIGPVITVALLNTGSYVLTFEMLALLLGIGFILSLLIKIPPQK